MHISKLVVAVMSLFASGTLLAQSVPPKQTPQQPVEVAVAPPPGPAQAVPGGQSAGSDAAQAKVLGGVNAAEAAAIAIGVASVAAAASNNGSTTTHH